MSSSVNLNLNLDFQDYEPSSSTGHSHKQYEEADVQVRIPTQSREQIPQPNLSGSRTILNLLQEATKIPAGSSENIPNETLQQLLWLSGKQKSKEQRDSITATSTWGLGYLARYFDISSEDVVERIVYSAIPVRKAGLDLDDFNNSAELMKPLTSNVNDETMSIGEPNQLFGQSGGKRKHYSYVERFIQSRPDFYGPLWISITLIFAVAIFSNIVSFSAYRKQSVQMEDLSLKLKNITDDDTIMHRIPLESWHYSVEELNMATSLVLSYVILMPVMLWFFFWFRGCTKYYTLTETICAYGYSLSIFIPISALLMLQNLALRYMIILSGAVLSGMVLLLSFLPIVKSDPNPGGSHIILVIVPACQLGLAYLIHRIMLQ